MDKSTTNKIDELRNHYRVKRAITKDEVAPDGMYGETLLKEGDNISLNPPIPSDPGAACELFKKYYAAVQFEVEKLSFEGTYKVWNKGTIKAEIEKIETWINEVEKINLSDRLTNKINVLYTEYSRLKNDFYEACLMTREQHNENSSAAYVYGRYFLFYDYLKSSLLSLKPNEDKQPKITLQTNLTPEQLKALHKALIAGNYIASNTKEIDFIYLLSGKPLNGMSKIKWMRKKPKSEAMYLLDKICLNLNLTTANNCIETDKKALDSNNRTDISNPRISEILESIQKIRPHKAILK